MADAPFFDPWPVPEPDDGHDNPDIDVPWMPPVHIAGVVVPVAAEVHRGEDVVVRVTHVVAYRRGLELHVVCWLRPGTRRTETAEAPFWQVQEPRVGVRLADGTRLGHRPPSDPAPPAEGPTVHFSQTQGTGGGLRSVSSWWVHPVPEGDTLEVVVEWEHQGVPESSATLDLGALRSAAAHEDVLWDPPPPPPENGYFGWSGPFSTGAYGSSLAMTFDDEADPRGD